MVPKLTKSSSDTSFSGKEENKWEAEEKEKSQNLL